VSLPDYLLDLPAEEAARLIALALLEQTVEAATRMAGGGDPAALHDFRVATRRLRSCLQAYRPEIDGSVSRRMRRRLARLARQTRRSRDLEVETEWARRQETDLADRHRAGLRWHLDRLDARRVAADERLQKLVAHRFPRLARRLRKRLEAYRLRIEADPSRRRTEAAAVLGSRLRRLSGDLECRLAAVRSIDDERAAHRARLAAKRLRYVLEPIRDEVEGVEPVIERLRGLQDVLGELHDSQDHRTHLQRELEDAPGAAGEAAGDDPRPGLLALGRRLESREATAFERLAAEWLHGAGEGFFEAVTAIGKRIASRPACVTELERRFLLQRVPTSARPFATVEIDQGWLPGTRLVERIRPLQDERAEPTYRTARSLTGATPRAPDGEADARLFEELWPLTEGRRVVKRRHVVPDYGLDWEIDEFLDRALVVAEVAVPAQDAPLVVPEWLERYVVREVTGEEEFAGRALAR
jgi:CHAD domain-containing protein/CYTH domain-containing protein